MATQRAKAESIGTRDRAFATIDRSPPSGAYGLTWWMPDPFQTNSEGAETPNPQRPMHTYAAMSRFNAWLSFCQHRMRKDFETLAGLTLCRTPQQAGDLWFKAGVDAVDDYAALFRKGGPGKR